MVHALERADMAVVAWLNAWAADSAFVSTLVRFIAGDYLAPVLLSLIVLAMWVAPRDPAVRYRYQRAAITALAGMGFAALVVIVINGEMFRPRPFVEQTLTLLFYRPTDSSFPLHAAAVGFGFATGVALADRRLGILAAALAAAWGVARVIGGVAYPTDALAGAGIGVVVTLAFYVVLLALDPVLRYVLGWARRLYLA